MPDAAQIITPWRWPHFTAAEFRCQCGCGRADMDPGFLDRLMRLRSLYGRPMKISSGYRCPKHNAAVSSTGADGPHTTGHAADIAVSRADALRLMWLAEDAGMTGVGVAQKGAARFIHVDDLPDGPGQPRPTIWSY